MLTERREIPRYPKIRHLGDSENKGIFRVPEDNIVIQEKFDGANFRFWREGDELCFGSRNISHLCTEEDYDQWGRQMDYLLAKVDPRSLDPDLVYCGEATKKHSISYNFDELPPFLLFDVLHIDSGSPLSEATAKIEADHLGLDFIERIATCKAGDIGKTVELDDLLKASAYRDGPPEGIAIKNYSRLNAFKRPLFAKITTEAFKERKNAMFRVKGVKPLDTQKVVDNYCTPARIRKQIFRLLEEEGKELGRPLMGDLIRATIHDILTEEIVNIWLDRSIKSIDFGELARLIPPLCLEEIDHMMRMEVESNGA